MALEERVTRIMNLHRRANGSTALSASLSIVHQTCSVEAAELLLGLDAAWVDYAAASVYAALMGKERRKRLGAYFTPPGLVRYLLGRAADFGVDIASERIRDPAAGGAAFIVPIAREMVKRWRDAGKSDREVIALLSSHLMGREIDPDLAKLANALLHRCLTVEYGMSPDLAASLELIATGDSLAAGVDDKADHEIGNPPFLRLAAKDAPPEASRFDDIVAGRLNLYSVFVRRGLAALPPGGILAYIIPASFIGGPEFRRFRLRIRQLAEVMAVDMIEGRQTVFTDVVQDTCVLVLRRRGSDIDTVEADTALSNYVSGAGQVLSEGAISLPPGDGPWVLPGQAENLPSTLSEWGYTPRIGYLVANRQQDRIHEGPAPGRVPLIWAKAIGQDGTFDFGRGALFRKHGWVDVLPDASYLIETGCVAIQRTSARNQKRRITAAEIPEDFVSRHGGIVAENHVILLVPNRDDPVPAKLLAAALNTTAVGKQLDRMCGSASIPARLLSVLPMPPVPPGA
ncbi:Eco57I restriction-modification methylase domain-containing protein [Devosia chinhatensis]|nr:N-6 DNA methylase [Devosia chinhatensis]